jgi:lipoprotein-anchoring transpeptidase ErfK/SrfK
VRGLFVHSSGAATRRWLVVVLLALAVTAAPVTGAAKAQKAIVVSISQQMLWAYKGDQVVLVSYVSTGRSGFDTPLGSFAVLSKLPSQTMEGVIGGEYYNVPDVPWVLYFTNSGHALHGTYWHNNFGTPMSHGCINLPMDVAAWLYDWAPLGTPVLVVQ